MIGSTSSTSTYKQPRRRERTVQPGRGQGQGVVRDRRPSAGADPDRAHTAFVTAMNIALITAVGAALVAAVTVVVLLRTSHRSAHATGPAARLQPGPAVSR